MSTPEEITAAFADATAAFDTIVEHPEDDDVHRLRRRATNLLQSVLFGRKSDSLSGLIKDRTDYAARYGHNFNRLEPDLPAYDPDINDNAKCFVQVCAE